MSNDKKVTAPSEAGADVVEKKIMYPHGRPVSRRQMLQAGLINFSAAITLPSVVEWLARSGYAEAQEACSGSSAASDMPVFVTLSMAGGAAMASNYVPLDQGGQLLPSYGLLGLGLGANLPITREFANQAGFAGGNLSGMIIGIRTGAQPTTLQRAVFVGVPNRSGDDSSSNKKDITGLVTKAGFVGNSIPNTGTIGSPTGGRHMAAYAPPPAPLIVNSYTDLANAVQVAGSLSALSLNQKASLFRTINRLTTTQAATLAGMSGGEQVVKLTKCATDVNLNLVASGSSGTSPLENAAFAQVWNINAGTNPADRNFVFAAMIYNACKGNGGTVNLTLGGYDYHGNARNNTNAQDQAAGLVIGRILQSAAVMNRKLFLFVNSDGAVGSQMSDVAGNNFTSDRGTGGQDYLIAFNPARAPVATGTQIGWFTAAGQSAATEFVTGGNPEIAAAAAFYNYMSFAGRLAQAEQFTGRVFNNEQMNQIVKIAA